MFAGLHEAPLAYLIIGALVVTSLWALRDRRLFEALRMYPHAIYRGNRVFTVFTSVFVHVDGKHLLLNVALLAWSLPEVEYMLVDDFGGATGRGLLLLFVVFAAAFAGGLSALQYRKDTAHRSTGASALAMAAVLFFLVYFPVVPLDVEASLLPPWLPVWLALGMIGTMLVFMLFRVPASAIHLYGAVAGILFALAARPQAIAEMAEVMCPSWN